MIIDTTCSLYFFPLYFLNFFTSSKRTSGSVANASLDSIEYLIELANLLFSYGLCESFKRNMKLFFGAFLQQEEYYFSVFFS